MSQPAYPRYKPSGIEWLGDVPKHWEVKPTRHLLVRNDGGAWGDNDDPDGTIVLRSTEQELDGKWRIEDPARRSLTPREKQHTLLRKGDLLITKSSGSAQHIGKTSIVTDDVAALDASFSNFMQRLRIGGDLEPSIAWYFLNCPAGRQQLVFNSNSTTGLANLGEGILGSVWMPVAPPEEQRAIAAFLDAETAQLDMLIEKKRRLIELLQEQRSALISRTVTRGLPPDAARAAGLDPEPPMKKSAIEWMGEIPSHWESGILRFYARMRSGHTPSRQHPEYWEECTIPWFSLADVWQLRNDDRTYLGETKELISELGLTNSAAELLPAGTVILSRTASVGFSGIMPRPMATTQDFVNWICGPKLMPEYLLQVFRAMKPEFERLVMGSTHKTIYMPDAASFAVAVPPLDEQKAIVRFLEIELDKVTRISSKVEEAIKRLREYRSALVTAAVTGKIDVRQATA